MARARARAPHVLLRAVLLVVGLGLVAGVAVLLLAHRFAAATPDLADAPAPGADPTADGEVFRGRGFTYTATVEQRKLFTISARNIRQDRDDRAFLEGVAVDIYRQGGDVVRVTSDEADYDQKSLDAELRGHVELRSRDLELDTRALELSEKGRVLISPGAVVLRYPPDLEGRANTLRVDLDAERYTLGGGVHLRSTPAAPMPFLLDADRLHHERDQGLVRAVGEVRLERGEDVIETENLTAIFDPAMRELQTVRARIDVRATFRQPRPPMPRRIDLRGKVLVAQFEPGTGGEPKRIELDAQDDGAGVDLAVIDDSGLGQTFAGRRIAIFLEAGVPRLIEGFGDALRMREIIDAPTPVVLREACAGRVEARFSPAGELGRVRLENNVELEVDDLYLTGGDVADLDWERGRVDAVGKPVSLFSRRGEVSAPHFVYRRAQATVEADSGVRATLPEDTKTTAQLLGATPLGHAEGPVMVESERATWTFEPQGTFTFLGQVRAWRGANLVLADQLRGDDRGSQLTASGDPVKTVWVPVPEPGAAGPPPGPLEVTAEQLAYSSDRSTLVYTGQVEARQAGSRLSCRQLTVELTPAGERAERMVCERDVVLVDATRGRRVRSERAVYDLDAGMIEAFGERVEVVEEDGNAFTCRYLLYDIATGAITVRSRPPETPLTTSAGAAAGAGTRR